jgi:hypothetical protein
MLCTWEEFGGKYRCMKCHVVQSVRTMRVCKPLHHGRTDLPAAESPGELSEEQVTDAVRILGYSYEDIKNWKAAVMRWWKAGRPLRSNAEVAAILALCKSNRCGKWNAETERCRECGCHVNLSAWAPKNKARMGTESCPQGFWG